MGKALSATKGLAPGGLGTRLEAKSDICLHILSCFSFFFLGCPMISNGGGGLMTFSDHLSDILSWWFFFFSGLSDNLPVRRNAIGTVRISWPSQLFLGGY